MKTPSRQLLVRTCTPVLNSFNDLFVMFSSIGSYLSVAKCGDSQTDEQSQLIFYMFMHQKNYQSLKIFCKNAITCIVRFLDASSHLYKRVCPSVRPSVGPWVGW